LPRVLFFLAPELKAFLSCAAFLAFIFNVRFFFAARSLLFAAIFVVKLSLKRLFFCVALFFYLN
jgi:hypothetical protein